MEDFQSATDQADFAMAAAKAAGDDRWVLNSTVLAAQANVHNRNLDVAMGLFTDALGVARGLQDTNAEVSIEHTMGEISKVQASATEPVVEGEEADGLTTTTEMPAEAGDGGDAAPEADTPAAAAADGEDGTDDADIPDGMTTEQYVQLYTSMVKLFDQTDLNHNGILEDYELVRCSALRWNRWCSRMLSAPR
jgi:hypothetical protein